MPAQGAAGFYSAMFAIGAVAGLVALAIELAGSAWRRDMQFSRFPSPRGRAKFAL